MVGSFEVGNEPLNSSEVVEFFDRGFAAPDGFCSNELDTITNWSCSLRSEVRTAASINSRVFWDTTFRRKLLLVFSALNYEVWVFSDAGNMCPYFSGACHDRAVTASISDGSEKAAMCTGRQTCLKYHIAANIQRVVNEENYCCVAFRWSAGQVVLLW
jgi:hypothetical protein